MSQAKPLVLYDKRPEDHVAILTLNRDEARNAFNYEMLVQFYDALKRANDDREVWVVVITGAGRAFSSGGDAKEFLANVEAGKYSEIEKFNRFNLEIWRFMEKMRKPIIAAVNGYCNIETIQAVDLVVASNQAKFGLPETGIGIMPGAGITVRLPRVISKYWAKYLLFTGEWISAEEAYRLGFVNMVVPHEQLMEKTMELVKKITKNAPLAVGAAKVAVNMGSEMPIDEGTEYQLKENLLLFYTDDLKEGIRAFFYEKRQPKFQGK